MALYIANNAWSLIGANVSSSQTTLAVASGADFPSLPSAADHFYLTLVSETGGISATLIDCRNGSNIAVRSLMYVKPTGVLTYAVTVTDRITSGAGAVGLSTWHHAVVSRVSGSTYMGLNGAQVGATYVDANNYTQGRLTLGASYDGTSKAQMNWQECRIKKGTGVSGRYAGGAYTVPTTPFPDSL